MHAVSQCVNVAVNDDLAYSRWVETEKIEVAAHTVPPHHDSVLMLPAAQQATINTPLTITCDANNVQTSLEPTTFDPSCQTTLSARFVLAAE